MNHEDYPILKSYGDRWDVEIAWFNTEACGFEVQVTTFTGPGAEQMARAMYDSIR